MTAQPDQVRGGIRGRFSTLPVRLATGILYAATFIGAMAWGNPYAVAAVCALFAGGAVDEFIRIAHRAEVGGRDLLAVGAAVALPFMVAAEGTAVFPIAFTVVLIIVTIRHVAQRRPSIAHSALTVFGMVYVGFSLSHLVLIRALDDGVFWALTVLVSVWANDVFAYLAGSAIGRHKMAPRISPKKTWEGFIAGTLASIAVWVGVGFLADLPLSLGVLAAVGFVLGLVGVGGDLFESRIKREVGVKDSGNVLPGHGGFLDRVDSLLAVSVVGYYILVAVGVS